MVSDQVIAMGYGHQLCIGVSGQVVSVTLHKLNFLEKYGKYTKIRNNMK
jgi:hypothetical protein